MGYKRQDNKEKILEALNRALNNNINGLTVRDMDKDLKTVKDMHVYLARLVNDGLVEWFNEKGSKYKTYRLTDKYFEPERQREALKTLEMIKGLYARGDMSIIDKNLDQMERATLKKYGII